MDKIIARHLKELKKIKINHRKIYKEMKKELYRGDGIDGIPDPQPPLIKNEKESKP